MLVIYLPFFVYQLPFPYEILILYFVSFLFSLPSFPLYLDKSQWWERNANTIIGVIYGQWQFATWTKSCSGLPFQRVCCCLLVLIFVNVTVRALPTLHVSPCLVGLKWFEYIHVFVCFSVTILSWYTSAFNKIHLRVKSLRKERIEVIWYISIVGP